MFLLLVSSCAFSSSSALVRCSSADCDRISWASRCDWESSSSVRALARMVLSTTPIVSTSWSSKVRCRSENGVEARQLDHAEHLALEEHRQHDQVVRRIAARPQRMVRMPAGVPHPDRRPPPRPGRPGPRRAGRYLGAPPRHRAVAGGQRRLTAARCRPGRRCQLGVHQRGHLGDDHVADLVEVALALHLAADPGQVRFSQSCCALRSVVSRRVIIWLMLSLSSATSPSASTAIPGQVAAGHRRGHSPIARSWIVSVDASWLTLSVRSRQVPATPVTVAWPPSFPSRRPRGRPG